VTDTDRSADAPADPEEPVFRRFRHGRHQGPRAARWRGLRRVLGRHRRLPSVDPSLLVLTVAAGLALAVLISLVLRPWAPVTGQARWAGPPGVWEMTFADGFEGDALDRSVWQPDRGGAKPALPFNWQIEEAWFDPSNVSVADGVLRFTVEREPRAVEQGEYDYSTGMVQTAELAVRPPVYVEARVRVPGCSGCWPAFWLHPVDRWPPEIDVMEYLEAGSEPRPSFNYIDAEEDRTGPDPYGIDGIDHRGEFHTYGVLWDGSRALPYLDGVAHEELAATEDMTSVPMMIILNLSLRSGYDVPPGEHMDVDWVRVWQPA
jgi:beta-glucanase (GH16 family)